MASRSAGRKGARWRRAKADAVAAAGGVCHLCGHLGAYEGDHVPARKILVALGLDPNDPRFIKASHGSSCRCPTCGKACNQVKGTRPSSSMPARQGLRTSRPW